MLCHNQPCANGNLNRVTGFICIHEKVTDRPERAAWDSGDRKLRPSYGQRGIFNTFCLTSLSNLRKRRTTRRDGFWKYSTTSRSEHTSELYRTLQAGLRTLAHIVYILGALVYYQFQLLQPRQKPWLQTGTSLTTTGLQYGRLQLSLAFA